jgi:hypothetical protein
MISGQFGENKELFFEIGLVTASGEEFFVEALFDTEFTDGWLDIWASKISSVFIHLLNS